jgi:lysyl-tRNA synthetase class 2
VAVRFELVIDGVEIANGYWELTDPQEHRQRFDRDLEERRRRRLTAHEVDEHFLAALQQGLPDCAGVALGVDRLVMLALGLDSIEDVLTFRA